MYFVYTAVFNKADADIGQKTFRFDFLFIAS